MPQGNAAQLEAEMARWLGTARERGRPDAYIGRRRWKRYLLGLSLEVTTAPNTPGDFRIARMHNVSGGGVGFWSDQELPRGMRIYVREHSSKRPGLWLAGTVSYCALGINGYLVGMTFDQPALPEVGLLPAAKGLLAEQPVAGRPQSAGKDRLSLATKCTLLSVGSVLAGLAMAWLFTWPPAAMFRRMDWNLVLGAVAGAGLAGLGSWVLVAGQSELLHVIRKAVHAMARGEILNTPLPEGGCREMRLLRQAVLDLGSRWRSHEDNEQAERRRLEEISQIKSNILSMVSHDLRTPLTSILLYTRMLLDEVETLDQQERRHFLEVISDECMRLTRMVDDLLDVQRLESGKGSWNVGEHDLAETVRACAEAFEPIARANTIQFTVDCPRSLPTAQVDPDRINQVLTNLLANAMKYTPSGGQVELSAHADEREIVLRVQDNGPGIPREKWDQIFDRFTQLGSEQAKEISGVGLGLYIVRQIAERHGGCVWVNSEIGRGAEFCVSLPQKPRGLCSDSGQGMTPQTGVVLICDADPELAAAIARLVRAHGMQSRVVHSASRLLQSVRQGNIDVVLTDIMLPDGAAADILSDLLAVANREYRVVVHSYEGDSEDLRRRGVDVVLRRPASEEEILLAVRTAMHKRSPSKRIALVPSADSTALKDLLESLTSAGYMIISQDDCRRLGTVAQNYPVDLILAWGPELGLGWSSVKRLGRQPGDETPVVILCDTVGSEERRLAKGHDVVVLPYRRGDEERVVAELSDLHAFQPEELFA